MDLETYGAKVVGYVQDTLKGVYGYSERDAREEACRMVWGGANSRDAAICQNKLQSALDSGLMAYSFAENFWQ